MFLIAIFVYICGLENKKLTHLLCATTEIFSKRADAEDVSACR